MGDQSFSVTKSILNYMNETLRNQCQTMYLRLWWTVPMFAEVPGFFVAWGDVITNTAKIN